MGQMISIQHAWRRCMITSGLIIRLVLHNKPEASSNLVKKIQNQSKNVLQVLPTERVLHVFSFLELKPYIVSHGVCKEWQQLLPLANIHPIRRRLFNLFHHMLSSPHFLEMRGWTLQHLQPFDRKAYIDSLLSQYPFIPEEFRIWTLDWPARMAICCMWPGLPFGDSRTPRRDEPKGVTWLIYKANPPELLTVVYRNSTADAKFIPALLVSRSDFATVWLIFERDEHDLFGRVLVNDDNLGEQPAIFPDQWKILDDEAERREGPDVVCPYFNTPFPDWITYQEYTWDSSLKRVFSKPLPVPFFEFRFIQGTAEFEICSGLLDELPSPSWVRCNEPIWQEYLQQN